jgi:hypothetical protein
MQHLTKNRRKKKKKKNKIISSFLSDKMNYYLNHKLQREFSTNGACSKPKEKLKKRKGKKKLDAME